MVQQRRDGQPARKARRPTRLVAITALVVAATSAAARIPIAFVISTPAPRGRAARSLLSSAAAVQEAAVSEAANATSSVPNATAQNDSPKGWAAHRFPGVRPDLVPVAPVESPGFVDEDALRKQNTFPIPEEDLVQLAKAFVLNLFSEPEEVRRRMAPDFRFVAPVVPAEGNGLSGPALCDALGQFNLLDAVPDLNPQQYDFRTDPFEPNRVWFTARGRGTNTGPVFGALPASGKAFESPPQSQSLTFNEKGEVTKMTIGYVMDKEIGTTGGLGGVFGIFYGIGYGLPFPEAQPWKPSPLYRLLFRTGNFFSSLRKLAR